jgi:cellulose synthase/poly-beta-1,6-N-acetylglucosamine synthase-like glycosyltransferase
MLHGLNDLPHNAGLGIFVYYGLSILIGVVLLIAAARVSLRYPGISDSANAAPDMNALITFPVSVLVPARNEERVITKAVRSLLQLAYPAFEIIVINDGSNDRTLEILRGEFDLVPSTTLYQQLVFCQPVRAIYRSRLESRLVVVDKCPGGSKADALNCGLNLASHPYICVVDADSVLEPCALNKVMAPIADDPERVVASSGVVLVGNRLTTQGSPAGSSELSSTWLGRIQVVEYLRAFLVERMCWSSRNMLMIISGAFGVFRKDLVLKLCGYRPNTMAEDLDLVIRLHRDLLERGKAYKISLIPNSICWTEAPSNTRCLAKQRARWHRGLLDVLLTNRDIFFNRRYGKVGLVAIPYLWVYELLSPVLETATWLAVIVATALGILQWKALTAIVLLGWTCAALLSTCAILVGFKITDQRCGPGNFIRLVASCFLEHVYYRPLQLLWKLWGIVLFVQGDTKWNSPERQCITSCPSPAASNLVVA